MEAVFAARPEAGGVFTDAEVVDEDLRPRGYGVCETFGLGRREDRLIRRGETLRMLMPQNCVTGATLAFRSRFRDAIFPIPKNTYWIHDGWIAVLIATLSELVYVPERLMLYRQHADQRIGAGPPPDTPRKGIAEAIAIRRRYRSDHYAQLAAQFQQLYDRAQAFSSEFCFSERAQRQLQGKIVHSRTRAGMPAPRPARLPLILRELLTGRYHLYSSGLRSAAKDLVF
jgi:hypothetical protein